MKLWNGLVTHAQGTPLPRLAHGGLSYIGHASTLTYHEPNKPLLILRKGKEGAKKGLKAIELKTRTKQRKEGFQLVQ